MCGGGDNQLFSLSSNGGTTDQTDFALVAYHSQKCVDLEAGLSHNLANVHHWQCSDSNANQHLSLYL